VRFTLGTGSRQGPQHRHDNQSRQPISEPTSAEFQNHST
jgi:hypothetical protein